MTTETATITGKDYPIINSYDPIKNSNYTPHPDNLSNRIETRYCLIRSKKLVTKYRYSKTDLAVYGALTRYLGKSRDGLPYPKQAKIAEVAKCTTVSVSRAVSKFEKDFVLYTRDTGRGKIYYFIPIGEDGRPNIFSGEYQFAVSIMAEKQEKKAKKLADRINKISNQDYQNVKSDLTKYQIRFNKMLNQLYQNVKPKNANIDQNDTPQKSLRTPVKPVSEGMSGQAPKNGVSDAILDNSLNNLENNNPPNPPSEKIKSPKIDLVVVGDLKKIILDSKLRAQFNTATYSRLKKFGLSDGQIKTLVNDMNAMNDIKSVGWLISNANESGVGGIIDYDEKQKELLKKQADLEASKSETDDLFLRSQEETLEKIMSPARKKIMERMNRLKEKVTNER